jgi:hypothetical protein
MENVPAGDEPQLDDEFAQLVSFPSLLWTLIREEGFTEVRLRNPQSGEVRMLHMVSMSLQNNGLSFVVSARGR